MIVYKSLNSEQQQLRYLKAKKYESESIITLVDKHNILV